jgi:predicted MFS family arabinose efflux permease
LNQKEKKQYLPKSETNSAMQFILLLGLVSAFGDITYETGRSVSGPYLALLGASAGMVGLVSGLGEFLGYALRLATGYIADRTRAYWLATFAGYGLLICIPLLAYTDQWELAALFLIMERVGKAIRSPSRDTILSYATHQTGRGWGFAIHEALDQVGAVIGPLLFSVAYVSRNSYSYAFRTLWIPAILTIAALIIARLREPNPEKFESKIKNQPENTQADIQEKKTPLPRIFWIYAIFTFFSVAGFVNYQIVSLHWVSKNIFPIARIPFIYAIAMGLDALAALAVGKSYDKFGLKSLGIIPILTLSLPFLTISNSIPLIYIGVILWGIVMAIHETIMRASIADLVPKERRGSAYGIFNTIYGAAWFIGSTALGFLSEINNSRYLWLFTAIMEIAAVIAFIKLRKSIIAGSET